MRALALVLCTVVALSVRAETWEAPTDDPASALYDAARAGASPQERRAFDLRLSMLKGRAAAELVLAFFEQHPEAHLTPAQLESLQTSLAEEGKEATNRDAFGDVLASVFAQDGGPGRQTRLADLVALRDLRTIPALGYLARRDAVLAVREQSARLLGEFRDAQAEAQAFGIATSESEPDEVRIAATKALEAQGTNSAGESLGKIALNEDDPASLRQAASDALRRTYPAIALRLGVQERVTDSSGRVLGAVVGALSGAYSLGLVGSLSPSEGAGTAAGVFGGLVIGGSGAYLLGSSADLSQPGALYLLSAGGWSVPVGLLLGSTTAPAGSSFSCPKSCSAVALGVHVASMIGAWNTKDLVTPTGLDVFETNVGALSGLLLSLGTVNLFERTGDVRPASAVIAAGTLAGFGLGAGFARSTRLTLPLSALGIVLAAESGVAGASLGYAWAPTNGPLVTTSVERRDDFQFGSTMLGIGLALGGTLAASSGWQPTGSEAQLIGFGSVSGLLLGMTVPMYTALSYPNDRAGSVGLAAGALLGGAGLGLLTKPLALEMSGGDGLLALFGLVHGVAQGALLTAQRPFTREIYNTGLVPGVTGLLGAAAIAVTQKTDVNAWQATWAISGAMWGYWLGYWTAYTGDFEAANARSTMLLSSNLGLGITALSLALDVNPTTLAWVNVGGVLGMTLGVLGATFTTDVNSTGHPVSTANVAGSVIGLLAGAFVAPSLTSMTSSSKSGSGGDTLDLPLPMVTTLPVTDPSGQTINGMGAQFTWQM